MSKKTMVEKIRELPDMKRHFLFAAMGGGIALLWGTLPTIILGMALSGAALHWSKREGLPIDVDLDYDMKDVLKNIAAAGVGLGATIAVILSLAGSAQADPEIVLQLDESNVIEQTVDGDNVNKHINHNHLLNFNV